MQVDLKRHRDRSRPRARADRRLDVEAFAFTMGHLEGVLAARPVTMLLIITADVPLSRLPVQSMIEIIDHAASSVPSTREPGGDVRAGRHC